MNSNQKRLSIVALILWGLTMIVVPWRIRISFHMSPTMFQNRVAFIWSTPRPHFLPREMANSITAVHSEILVPIVILEWLILAVFYLIFLKAYKDMEVVAGGGTGRGVGNQVPLRKGI